MALNVAFVIETSGGGSGRHLLDLAAGLVERGHRVHVLYSEIRAEPRFVAALKAIAGLHIASVPMRRSPHPTDFTAWNFIRAYLERHGPFDVVHGQSSKGGALGRLAVTDKRSARVYTPHCFRTLDPELSNVGHIVFGNAELVLSRMGEAIICVSPEELEHAVQQGIARDKLHLVYNGVKAPDVSGRERLRERLGIAKDEISIGFLGRYVPQKAPERMVEVAAALPGDLPPWRITMIGEGQLEEAVRMRAKEAGIDDRFAWGPGDIGPTAMAAFDLFTMPSVYEGMPYVLIEAAAAGLPIIATDVGGAKAVIVPGENGAIVPNWNSAAFAAEVATLIRDKQTRAAMSKASLRRAQSFTIDAMVDQTLAIYELAIEHRRSPVARARTGAGAAIARKENGR